MNFSYLASDKTISEILDKTQPNDKAQSGKENNSQKRPDLFMFFEKKGADERNKSVIIELKASNLANDAKMAQLAQLNNYIAEFKEYLEESWYYYITTIDDDFAMQLKNNNYKELFSSKNKIYYQYFDNLQNNIYVISLETIISDAKARQKSFLDVIKNSLQN